MPTCCSQGEVITNHALGKEFLVCTACLKEVTPTPDPNEVRVWSTTPGTPQPLSVEEVSNSPLDYPGIIWMGD